MTMLENKPFDELEVGDRASYTKRVTEQDVEAFGGLSGDMNPLHFSDEYAATTPYGGRVAHGMIVGALVSAAIGTRLPGPGSIYLKQSLAFHLPVRIDDEIEVTIVVQKKLARRRFVTLACEARNQAGEKVADGEALVIAPDEKLRIEDG
jgi:3-hydroxybutyryl-CoA dehydratase